MSSDTDPRRFPAAALALVAASVAAGPAVLATAAPIAAAATAPARHPGAPPVGLATPAQLRSALEKAGKMLGKAEDALRGNDAGKVSLFLSRSDEYLEEFHAASGLQRLVQALKEARAAAGGAGTTAAGGSDAAGAAGTGAAETGASAADGTDLAEAAAAVRRARDLMTPVAEYTVLRQGAEAGHAALRAAGARDRAGFLAALDRLEAATLAPVLLARLREARDGISRGRLAMVRRDMQEGRAQVAAARRACDGLEYAGALSRASFALSVGSELLASDSVIAARHQIQKALRDLRRAAAAAPGGQQEALEQARAEAAEVWKRSGKSNSAEAGRLADIARRVETVRLQQR
ncbi:MAG: hypothetical protein HYS34_08420 [Acidobacteria bacterium]|nr:hypothetical protein [Acidobacteriota bacterium]